MIGHQYFYRHHDSALIETISQNDIYQILLNLEEVFLAIFLIVSCCLMLQLIAFYYVYVTYHHVQHRSTPISPPSYEASRENSNFVTEDEKDKNGFKIDESDERYMALGEKIMLDKFVPDDTVIDSYCPSLKALIKNRTCQCGFYSPSIKSNREHKESKCCVEVELIVADFEDEETEAEAVFTDSNERSQFFAKKASGNMP